MYRINRKFKPKKPKYKLWISLTVIFVIVSFVGIKMIARSMKSNTQINQATGKQTKVNFTVNRRTFDFSEISISVPTNWTIMTTKDDATLDANYAFKSNDTNNFQTLRIYVDRAPSRPGMGKVVIVRSTGSGMEVVSSVSDNCAKDQNGTNRTPAVTKEQGVDFTCDYSGVASNALGISSANSLDSVNLLGSTTGKTYKVYVKGVFGDTNPDYSDMLEAIKSIRMK